MLVEGGRVAELLEVACVHHRDGVGHGHGLLLVVGDVDEGQADVVLDPLELDLHLPAQLEVEGAERLVEQQDVGPVDEGPGQGDALLHATGELVGLLAARVVQLDELEGLLRLALGLLVAATAQAELHVVLDAHVREERVGLEHGVDVALVGTGTGDVGVADVDAAAGRRLETRDHPQGRRLAAARRAEQGEERALRDGQVEGVDRREVAERLREGGQPQVSGPVLRHQLAVRSENAREYLVSSSAVSPRKTFERDRTSALGKISGLSAVSGSSAASTSLVPLTGGM